MFSTIKFLSLGNNDYDLYIIHNYMKDKKLWSHISYPPKLYCLIRILKVRNLVSYVDVKEIDHNGFVYLATW